MLADFFGLASSAATAALNAGKTPGDDLHLLELGRGVIAGLMMDMRADITDLQLHYPHLEEKFSLLWDELDLPTRAAISLSPDDKMSSWALQGKRRREADREFNEILNEIINTIHSQPGFSNFLQPPAADEIRDAAEPRPIVIKT